MPRRATRQVPRWRRGKQASSNLPVQFRGRHARALVRELVKQNEQAPGKAGKEAAAKDALVRSGAWRFRRHLPPFIWLACLVVAGLILNRTAHPLLFGNLAGLALPVLLILFTRHLPAFGKRTADVAALAAAVWLPLLAEFGVRPCIAWLVLTWAPLAALWVRKYRWRPDEQAVAEVPVNDLAVWERLAARKKWSGQLTAPEQIPGGGRKWLLQLDGAETHIGQVTSDPRAIAAAYDKPQTEAYVEPHPSGIESRGYLTILRSGTLDAIQEWDGQGITAEGFARIGRFADSQPTRLRFWVPRDGTRHSLIAGTSGAGKSVLLDLLVWLAITSPVPVIPVILDPQNGQSLPQWRGKVPYAAGLDECFDMLAGLYAGMMGRSRQLADTTWADEDGYEHRGFEFFDHALTGLPVVMPIIDEAPMILNGGGNAKRAAQAVMMVGELAKLARKTGLSVQLVAQVPSLSELGDQSLRSMLVGGNVVCLRTGDRVSAPMLGIDVDPSSLPKYFPGGEPTGGLGYAISVDSRQAPMRVSPVPAVMRRNVPAVAPFDDLFESQLSSARLYWRSLNGGLPGPAPESPGQVPPEDAPEGRRCIDAVWQVLADSGKPMERGEVIKWVNELAVTGWGRAKPFSIRAIGDALNKLVTDPPEGRSVIKVRDGVYQVGITSRNPASDHEQGAA